jgi:hypothetical protein
MQLVGAAIATVIGHVKEGTRQEVLDSLGHEADTSGRAGFAVYPDPSFLITSYLITSTPTTLVSHCKLHPSLPLIPLQFSGVIAAWGNIKRDHGCSCRTVEREAEGTLHQIVR